jgi:hypothetical protein
MVTERHWGLHLFGLPANAGPVALSSDGFEVIHALCPYMKNVNIDLSDKRLTRIDTNASQIHRTIPGDEIGICP